MAQGHGPSAQLTHSFLHVHCDSETWQMWAHYFTSRWTSSSPSPTNWARSARSLMQPRRVQGAQWVGSLLPSSHSSLHLGGGLCAHCGFSGHSRLNSGMQPFSFNSPRQHLCQTQTDAGGWWHNPDQEPSYNFNARNHCLKESPAVPPCRLFSLAVVPQFQLSTAFQLATPLSLDHLFRLGFQTPDRKFQILLPLMIREVILFVTTHWSSPHIWFLMPSRPTQTHQGIDIPSTCCPLFSIYYKSWNKAILKVKVLVIQLCLTLCDPMDSSPPGSSVHGILWPGLPEWVAITFSRGFSWPRDQTRVSCIAGKFLLTEPPGKPLKVFKTFIFEGVHYTLKANDEKQSDFSNASFQCCCICLSLQLPVLLFPKTDKVIYDRLRPGNDTQKCGLVSF